MYGFGKLPLELRQAIWEKCLPDPRSSPEIYFYNRDDFGHEQACASDNGPGGHARLKVVIDFPVILHVCYESRDFALRKHGVSFQLFPQRPVHLRGRAPSSYVLMPCRPYRPETDVFLITEDNMGDLWETSDRQRNDPHRVFGSIRHLAFGSWHMINRDAIDFWLRFLCTLPRLRHVSIVFGYYWGLMGLDDSFEVEDFRDSRHSTLAPFTEETAGLHPEISEEMIEDIPELTPVVVPDFIARLNNRLSMIEVLDDVNAPWDKDSGRWLFSIGAQKMVAESK